MSGYKYVSPEYLNRRIAAGNGPRLIDVRNFDEFAAVHVRGAECTPLPQILHAASSWNRDEEFALICKSGQRARQAADRLREAGFRWPEIVDGGTDACVSAGLPVVRGRKTVPLQRQVLIAAGLVVLIGLSAGLAHPAFRLISWFASVALITAGITGFCPMAKFLAAAPWNRSSAVASSCNLDGACS